MGQTRGTDGRAVGGVEELAPGAGASHVDAGRLEELAVLDAGRVVAEALVGRQVGVEGLDPVVRQELATELVNALNKIKKTGRFKHWNNLNQAFRTIWAQKDLETYVKNDQTLTIDNCRMVTVKKDETVDIQNNQKITVKQDHSLTVTQGNRTIEVQQGNNSLTVDMGNHATDVKMGNVSLKADLGQISNEAMQSIENELQWWHKELESKGKLIEAALAAKR